VRPSAASTALKALPTEKNYIDTGKVRFASNDLPLDFHPKAQRAAEAAWCAGEQNKYWEQRDTMINNSGDLSKDAITKYAQTISKPCQLRRVYRGGQIQRRPARHLARTSQLCRSDRAASNFLYAGLHSRKG
jgi:hypothetical protein